MKVAPNTVVSFRYIMKNGAGEIMEDTSSGIPTRYLHGTDAISRQLQMQMEGMEKGNEREIYLNAEIGSPGEFSFLILLDGVREAEEKEIILGYPLREITSDCKDDCECYQTEKYESTPA